MSQTIRVAKNKVGPVLEMFNGTYVSVHLDGAMIASGNLMDSTETHVLLEDDREETCWESVVGCTIVLGHKKPSVAAITVDGQSPFWVRDLDSNPGQPHGWRSTSRGFALVGCEPTTEDDPLRYPLDFSDETANIQSTAELFNRSIFNAIRVLDRCRRYEFVNFHIGDEGPREFTHVAGPYEVEAQTFTAARAPARYRLRCACGAESKWYLGGNMRHLRAFHSAHRCPK